MDAFFRSPDAIIILEVGLALLAGLAVLALIIALIKLWSKPGAKERRLNILVTGSRKEEKEVAKKIFLERLSGFLMIFAPQPKAKPSWDKSKLLKDLISAGFRSKNALRVFQGLRAVLSILLPLLGLGVGVFLELKRMPLLICVFGGAFFGFFLPKYILEKKSLARGAQITKQMPNMLDLLVIAVESGLGLDAAVKRVSKDLVTSSPILAEELQVYSMELKLGSTREVALRNLAARCGVDEMSSLAGMLIQADRFGVSVGRSLRVYSDEIRTKRRQQMEEAAAKIPLKLLFPVLFMIFPAIMAVMAGPAIINIMESIIE
ncbi:type II secretion system F family protein [Dethiosulfatarculus sandiegensis]|uniref:Type II secretion system protein n=1 Tax=Dethiosulfatarculus sandiegensis TaxID=1429043 RepID=A0A0D2J6L0_9BACT|nr:type II secretion system F family protein [Dethiosulfatarculus sandiegensis]KIX13799.1 type II secretion system protein [Dethiosulfatarculus sandiegensis]